MEITIRQRNEGPSVLIKKNDEVVAGTGVTPAMGAPAPQAEPAKEEIKKVG